MKKLSALFLFSILFIIYLAFPESVFATTTCDSPNGGTYTTTDSVGFTVTVTGLSAIDRPGTISWSIYLNGGTYIGGNSASVSPPLPNTASDTIYGTLPQGNYTGWNATVTYNSDDGTISASESCQNNNAITVNAPGPDLNTNISFSAASPTGGEVVINPVTFSITIQDTEPTEGTRTIEFWISGALQGTFPYEKANLVGNSISGSVTQDSPTGSQFWYVVVSMGGSSKQSPLYNYIAQDPATPTPSETLLPPWNMQVSCDAGGLTGPDGLEWCNATGPRELTATGSTKNGETPNFNISGISTSYSSGCNPPNNNISNCAAYPDSSGWTNGTTYYWSAWTSGTSGGNWTSPTGTATNESGAFGIDTQNPTAPGTPILTQEGGTWKIKWGNNGTDAESGIGIVKIKTQDITAGCIRQDSFQESPFMPTEITFQNCSGSSSEPIAGHTYSFGVSSCDYALNCGTETPGSYDGTFTPTYSIYGNVFVDYNGDGIRNTSAGFPPDEEYPGGDVQIYMNGTPTTNTDGFGNYVISGLTNANYSLEAVPPASYIVSTANPITAFINNADSYGNDFGIRPLGGPQPTSTPPPAGYPVIKTLKTKNPQTLTFTGTFGTSGRQDTESGSKWLNPMRIRLSVEQGTNSINRYFVAFYDKSSGAKLTSASSFLSNVKTRLSNSRNGFLLAYGLGNEFYKSPFNYDYLSNNFYVWNKNTWEKITTSNYTVCDGTCNGSNALFTATKIATGTEASTGYRYVTWEIKFNKDLGSKQFYTPALVIDQMGQSDFNSSLTVTELLN